MALAEVVIDKLNYLWRLVGTAIGFTTFGVGGVILAFLVFPIVRLITPNANIKLVSRKIVSRCFHFFISLLDFLGVYDFDYE